MAHSFIGLRKPLHHDKAVFMKERLLYTEWIHHKVLLFAEVLLYAVCTSFQYPVINQNGKEYEKECIYVYNRVTLLYSRN